MRRARRLAAFDRRILSAYGERTVGVLRAVRPLRLVLTQLEPILASNIDKEVRKDALAMQCAAEAVLTGTAPDRSAVRQLLEASKAIDQSFLARARAFPVRIAIRYEEILPLRTRRIERLLGCAYRILAAWPAGGGVRSAVQASHSRAEFEQVVSEVLGLYALETRALSRSVRLPLPLAPLRDLAAQRVAEVMSSVAVDLAREIARQVYGSPVTRVARG